MPVIPKFEDQILQKICDIIGNTTSGLTGSEIGKIFLACRIDDVSPTTTKRDRLFEALRSKQSGDGCGNNVVAFIQVVMNPVRYVENREVFETRRLAVNRALAFCGMKLGEDGKMRDVPAAKTLSEAEERASKLRRELISRQVHADVLAFCRTELLQDNYFHAVFEATKSVADKIRQKSGLLRDGASLVEEAFSNAGTGTPLLAFNSLQTESEQSEHKGLSHLLKGIFATFRNVTAHEPKIKWVITEQDALDLLSLASFLHRRLDNAVRTR
ncbi:MAG: TIGR02391 family protein [Blastocatellales bacterium]